MGFISEWEITSKTVGFKLPSFLQDVMIGLDEPRNIFQLVNWEIFNHFSGKYEAILYKLCRDYVGVRRTPYMTMDEFREYMGLQPTEYTEFQRLGQRVIYGPCKAINESPVSGITVEPQIERQGRKAAGISFLVEPRDKTLVSIIEKEQPAHPAFLQAKAPILPKNQEKYLALRTAEAVGLCIERANEYGGQQEQAGKPPNYGALYRAAIEEGWHLGRAEKKAAEKAKRKAADEAEKARKQAGAETEAAKKARAADSQARLEAALEAFKALPEARQQALVHAFLETDALARGWYKKKGFDSPFFFFPFVHFLQQRGKPA
jgi:hypothetical protein